MWNKLNKLHKSNKFNFSKTNKTSVKMKINIINNNLS